MNLEARKIEFVQEFLNLQSEEVILKLERILRNENGYSAHEKIVPMSVEEFKSRIEKSLEDSKNGKLTESKDLLVEIEKWS